MNKPNNTSNNKGKGKEEQIIIKKKRRPDDPGHNESWKVAYADFVTAMMAFFMAMWIINLDPDIRQMIEAYFNDPFGRRGVIAGALVPSPTYNPGGQLAMVPLSADRGTQRAIFTRTIERIRTVLAAEPDLSELAEFVEMRVAEEGLIIDLIDSAEAFFFELGSAQVTPQASRIFELMAMELGRLPNPIVIEGHTDVLPYKNGVTYTNWELSVDRANSVRRIMQESGLRPRQVSEVRGYADTRLRVPEDPTHYSNRRVSILAKYISVE